MGTRDGLKSAKEPEAVDIQRYTCDQRQHDDPKRLAKLDCAGKLYTPFTA